MHQLCCMKRWPIQSAKCMIFCLKIEEFLLFLTCCFKFTTNHESKFASTCKMCFPNTCKTVLCSGNQFPVKIHIFLFFNFVPSLHGIAHQVFDVSAVGNQVRQVIGMFLFEHSEEVIPGCAPFRLGQGPLLLWGKL